MQQSARDNSVVELTDWQGSQDILNTCRQGQAHSKRFGAKVWFQREFSSAPGFLGTQAGSNINFRPVPHTQNCYWDACVIWAGVSEGVNEGGSA